jgi:hypothetical protein
MESQNNFYDKNGTLIKLGDKLLISEVERDFYKDGIVVEQEDKLGLLFVHKDFFVTLDSLCDDFFEECEIINK